MTSDGQNKPENTNGPARTRRSVATYLGILFVIAILLLLLAYFMQERTYAQTSLDLLSIM